jgi:hypothetical protein
MVWTFSHPFSDGGSHTSEGGIFPTSFTASKDGGALHATAQFITKTKILPKSAYTDGIARSSYLVSTDIESDKYALGHPIRTGTSACSPMTQAKDSAMASNGSLAGGMVSTVKGASSSLKHPSFRFSAPVRDVWVEVVEEVNGVDGRILHRAHYDLTRSGTQTGSDMLPSDLAPDVTNDHNEHRHFSPFSGPEGLWKNYKLRVYDGTMKNLNENLRIKSGIFKVMMMKPSNTRYDQSQRNSISVDAASPVIMRNEAGNVYGVRTAPRLQEMFDAQLSCLVFRELKKLVWLDFI